MIERLSTKELLAKSLKELAKTKPIDKITIKDITDNWGLSKRTFYHNFQDKAELVLFEYSLSLSKVFNAENKDLSWLELMHKAIMEIVNNYDYYRNAFHVFDSSSSPINAMKSTASSTFEDFINAFDNVSDEYKDKIRLHLFTPNRTLFEQILSKELLDKTTFNNNIDYLKFLNLSTKFDVLIVEDSFTEGHFIKNPYLPSKLSDYNGSNTTIWAICEENSEMSKLDIEYKSYINDLSTNINALNSIMCEKTDIPAKLCLNEENKYRKQRTTQLTQKIIELIDVCEAEFGKNDVYEAKINELNQIIQNLEKENSQIMNSNSWKMTKNLRKIGKKFK